MFTTTSIHPPYSCSTCLPPQQSLRRRMPFFLLVSLRYQEKEMLNEFQIEATISTSKNAGSAALITMMEA